MRKGSGGLDGGSRFLTVYRVRPPLRQRVEQYVGSSRCSI